MTEQYINFEGEYIEKTISRKIEHQIHYKTDFDGKDTLVDELRKCAETISQTDHEMMEIRSKMEKLIDVPSEEEILLARMRKLDVPIE